MILNIQQPGASPDYAFRKRDGKTRANNYLRRTNNTTVVLFKKKISSSRIKKNKKTVRSQGACSTVPRYVVCETRVCFSRSGWKNESRTMQFTQAASRCIARATKRGVFIGRDFRPAITRRIKHRVSTVFGKTYPAEKRSLLLFILTPGLLFFLSFFFYSGVKSVCTRVLSLSPSLTCPSSVLSACLQPKTYGTELSDKKN